MFDDMSFDEIEQWLDEFLDSPEFDKMSRKFFGDLVEADDGKAVRQDFENDWKLRKNAEVFCYWK